MFVWAIADRFLDMIGLFSLLYWTIKATRWFSHRRKTPDPLKPRAFRVVDDK